MTLTEIIEQLKENQQDLMFDLSSDWVDDDDKRKMVIQLGLLNQSIANLELIHSDKDGQIFRSSISF